MSKARFSWLPTLAALALVTVACAAKVTHENSAGPANPPVIDPTTQPEGEPKPQTTGEEKTSETSETSETPTVVATEAPAVEPVVEPVVPPAAAGPLFASVETTFKTNCAGCHKPGGKQPELATFEQVKTHKDSILRVLISNDREEVMPKFNLTFKTKEAGLKLIEYFQTGSDLN